MSADSEGAEPPAGHGPSASTAAQEVETARIIPIREVPASQPCRKCGYDPGDASTTARAALQAAKASLSRREAVYDRYLDDFAGRWDQELDLPSRWRASLRGLCTAGLPRNVMLGCVDIALGADHVSAHSRFKYFAGVAWHRVRELEEDALARMERAEAEEFSSGVDGSP